LVSGSRRHTKKPTRSDSRYGVQSVHQLFHEGYSNVDALRAFLQFPDVECFVSEYTVMPGAPIAATTKAAILACDLFVLLWSKNAVASEWVNQEIGIAH